MPASPLLPAAPQVTRAHGALAHTKAGADEWQMDRQRLVQEYVTKQVGGVERCFFG